MFTIEKRISKSGKKPYIAIFSNGKGKPFAVNNYEVLSVITGMTYAELAEVRHTDSMDIDLCYREFDENL